MQNRFVIIKGELFDRELLVEGKTKEGILIPKGGVIIGKNSLSGFINSPKYQKIKWKIIGKIKDSLIEYIPKYKNIKNNKKEINDINDINDIKTDIPKDKVKKYINVFRQYYRNEFN